MRQYKIFTTANKLNIIDQKTNIIYSALLTEALVRQLKDGEDGFKIYNVRDWNEDKILTLKEILKEDGSKYTSVEDFIGNFNGGGSAPKTYRALVTQVSTDAPTAIVLENTFGEELVWTYNDVGKYILTSANGNFVDGKTFVFTGNIYNTAIRCDFLYNVTDTAPNGIFFQTLADGVNVDSLLANIEVQILVYP